MKYFPSDRTLDAFYTNLGRYGNDIAAQARRELGHFRQDVIERFLDKNFRYEILENYGGASSFGYDEEGKGKIGKDFLDPNSLNFQKYPNIQSHEIGHELFFLLSFELGSKLITHFIGHEKHIKDRYVVSESNTQRQRPEWYKFSFVPKGNPWEYLPQRVLHVLNHEENPVIVLPPNFEKGKGGSKVLLSEGSPVHHIKHHFGITQGQVKAEDPFMYHFLRQFMSPEVFLD
jgi:hypothetical protein